ncbi:MAG: Na(+)-translocating NADH-quinone reductase subunit A [Pseudomonadota bacterium]
MTSYRLKKGLDLPVAGAPEQRIVDGPTISSVAALGADYLGLKPRLAVKEGDVVGAGAPLFAHKDTPETFVTTPVSGRVSAINRGHRRALVSVVIETDPAAAEPVDFSAVGSDTEYHGIVERLCKAGLWTSFRMRPYSKVPAPADRPAAIFVTATDTEPLSPDPSLIIGDAPEAFARGMEAVATLSEGTVYLCQCAEAALPGADTPGVEVARFDGPHPAGLAGTHMHFLDPPSATKVVWSIGYQDVIAIGRLMLTGRVDFSRVVALGGPLAREPRLVRTVLGANFEELLAGEYDRSTPSRIISGSILSGRAPDAPEAAFLSRYARQVTIIEEDREQIPLGWVRPMFSKFAYQPVLGSMLKRVKSHPFTSNLNGGRRAMVPLGTFEELMPQDFLPTQLLRALLVMDTDSAQALGALELDEEDLSLVGFACPAKYEYGLALRDCLTKIEREG